MNMQTLALAFLVAVAIGGVAWVFLYPLLSGERKAERRRASVARAGARRARQRRQEPALAPRAGRGIAEGARARRKKRRSPSRCSIRIAQAGLDLVEAANS